MNRLVRCLVVLVGCAAGSDDDSTPNCAPGDNGCALTGDAGKADGFGHGTVHWIGQYDGLPNAASDCGPATMAMAAAAYGAFPDLTNRELITTLAAARGNAVSALGGTPALGMERMARDAGLKARLNADSSFARMTRQLAAGDLIAVAGDSFSLPYRYDPSKSEGHWILATSYANGVFEIMDPADTYAGSHYLTNAEIGAFLAGNYGDYRNGGTVPIW